MYYDLLAQLRRCAEGRCRGCPRSHAEGCRKSVSTEAADAIEKLCSFVGSEDAERMEAYLPKEEKI